MLYDNRSEIGFAAMRAKQIRGIAVSVTVFTGMLVLFWYVIGAYALSTGDPTKIALWLSGSAVPAFLLVFGGLLELQRPGISACPPTRCGPPAGDDCPWT
jgi:hypothetical protein